MKYSSDEHERGLIAFLEASQKRRVAALMGLGPKRRKDVLDLFYHHLSFDQKFSIEIDRILRTESQLVARMVTLGAPSQSYVMSTDPEIDQAEMPLEDAISAAYGANTGTFVSCIPGKLGYFESEDMGGRYLLSKDVGA